MYTQSWQENTYIVTGSSGSGKSQVCRILASLGAKIVSADELAREALAPGSKGIEAVRATFGEKVFDSGGLNRKALGAIIFSDSASREKLEEITHPIIGELAEEKFAELSKAGAKILIYDCPLFFETKLKEKKYKGIILVTATPENKVARLVARDNITEEAAKQRLTNQLSDAEKIPLSTVVIENNGSLTELEEKTKKVFQQLY